MNKRITKEQWIAAIERCLRQENYGITDHCELCKMVMKKSKKNPTIFREMCGRCICCDYIKSGHPRLGKVGRFDPKACCMLLAKFYNKKQVHRVLHRMSEWLKGLV